MAAHEGDRTTKFDVVWVQEQEEDDEEDEEEESAVAEIKHLVIHSNSFVEFEPWARAYFKLCVWATEWPEEWYIDGDGEWEDTEIYVQVARGHDGRLFLQDSTRGLEIGSVELNYDALNTMPVHRHACSLKMEYLGFAHPVEDHDWRTNDYNQREAHHNRVLQLLWEWLWHVKRHLGLTFELRRIHFDDAVRTQPLGDGKSIGDSSHDDPWLRLSVTPRELRQREDGRRVARRLDPSHVHAWSARAAGNAASLSPYCI